MAMQAPTKHVQTRPVASNIPSPRLIISLYRLILRHAAASVLYAHPARINLSNLYRPEFDTWMRKAKYEDEGTKIAERDEWEEFARRFNNTLAFLHHSSHYKGTTLHRSAAHKTTSNLSSLKYFLDPQASVYVRSRVHSATGGPASGGGSALRTARPEFIPGELGKKKTKRASDVLKMRAWDGLAEVVGMAEGSAGLLLGKTRPREPRPVDLDGKD